MSDGLKDMENLILSGLLISLQILRRTMQVPKDKKYFLGSLISFHFFSFVCLVVKVFFILLIQPKVYVDLYFATFFSIILYYLGTLS